MYTRLTIKQIAELAGVSGATVSKVINNKGRYSEETRQRVMDIINENGYRPNAVAKSLRTSKSKTIGIIVPDITNEFFAEIVLAIEKHCEPYGYSVFICNTNEDEKKELHYLNELELKGVDGFIFLSGSDYLFQSKTTTPIVCIDRHPKFHSVMTVTSDNYTGGRLAAEELLQQGCKKILLMRGHHDNFPTNERCKGFEEYLKEFGLIEEIDIIKSKVDIMEGRTVIRGLLDKGHFEYDGVFATTDWLALGTLLALEEKGIKVPEKVKIVGYDDISLAKYTSITSINQNKELLGRKAAKNLIEMIENKHIEHSSIIKIPVTLSRRKTTDERY